MKNEKIIKEFLAPQLRPKDYLDQIDFFETCKNMAAEISSLRGHIRRLEKSNQELGEELHRCKNPDGPKGWD